MLVLLKTAFYVAGWVMGVNGFGKRGSYCFGAKYIARSILSYHHFLSSVSEIAEDRGHLLYRY